MSAVYMEDFYKTDMYGFTLLQAVADLAQDQGAPESSVAGKLAYQLLRADNILGQHITLTARKEDTGKDEHKVITAERAGIHLYALHGDLDEGHRGLTWDEAEHGDEKEAGTNVPLRWFRIDKKIVIALLRLAKPPIPIPESWLSGKRAESKHPASGEQQEVKRKAGVHSPGDLSVIVDEINQTVTVFLKNDKEIKYTRRDIVGKGTTTWDLLVVFAKYGGSLEGIVTADVEKANTPANRKHLDEKLVAAMSLDKSPIVKGKGGGMGFRSIQLAGGTSSADALGRKTISLDDQATAFLKNNGEDMPV